MTEFLTHSAQWQIHLDADAWSGNWRNRRVHDGGRGRHDNRWRWGHNYVGARGNDHHRGRRPFDDDGTVVVVFMMAPGVATTMIMVVVIPSGGGRHKGKG